MLTLPSVSTKHVIPKPQTKPHLFIAYGSACQTFKQKESFEAINKSYEPGFLPIQAFHYPHSRGNKKKHPKIYGGQLKTRRGSLVDNKSFP